MSRRREVKKRDVMPDPKFGDKAVATFICKLMVDGKKSVAERTLYGAFDIIEQRLKDDPLRAFKKALDNLKPSLEVKARRVGGATYQVPVEVRPSRRLALSMRWLTSCARKRSEKTMRERLAGEIMDAVSERGSAFKKREEVHKMAEANRAFAHYRW